jgi:hypothetical protein
MWETFQTDPESWGVTVMWCVIVLAILAGVGFKAWRKNEAGKRDAELKMEMLARGMSANDIVRVLAAKANGAKLDETAHYDKK